MKEEARRMTDDGRRKPEVVVSMTSFPAAISYAEEALRVLLRGSELPDRMVLYLTLEQFGGKEGVPESLRALERENSILEIRDYPRDIRSYRKLIPAVQDFPDAIIVTVDDDVAYHRHMLRDLLRLHQQEPHAVLAHRAKRINPWKPYRKWHKYRWYHFLLRRIYRSYLNLPTGVGGVLYPPHALAEEMLDPELFTQLAPSTDDVWFWAAAARGGYPVIPVPMGHNKPKGLGKPKGLALKTTNFKGRTDRNVEALRAIMEHYPDLQKLIK